MTATCALACGSSSSPVDEPASAPEAQPAPQAGGDDITALCVSLFARQYECTDEYIPALVDQRISLDVPAGIAQEGATPEGRDALIASAKQEWAVDGAEPARTQTCQQIAASLSQQDEGMVVDMANTCLAKDSCTDLVACVAPMQRKHLEGAKAAQQ